MAGLIDMLRGALGGQGGQQQDIGGVMAAPGTPTMDVSGRQQGGGAGDFLQALGPAIAMLDPRNQQLGAALMQMNAGRQEKAQQRQSQNQTVSWLKSKGVGEDEAAYLASDPTAFRSWFGEYSKGSKPDWQITDIYDEQGRQQKVMFDKNTGRYSPLGGAKQAEETALERQLQAGGLQPGTPEYQQAILEKAGGGVNVDARQMGSIPPGYQVEYDEAGRPARMSPIAGSPAAMEAEAAQRMAGEQDAQRARYADVVTEDIDRSLAIIDSANLPTTGAIGSLLSGVGGTAARDLDALLTTIRSNAGFDRLQAMREASPTGGALGAVSDFENRQLQSTIGNLEQSQSADQLKQNLNRVYNTYMDIVHGKGNGPERRQIGGSREDAQGGAPRQIMDEQEYINLPSGAQFIAPDGSVRRKP